MIYMDSSALVTWMSRRNYWTALDAFLGDWGSRPMATSSLGFVETTRTLDLMGTFPDAMAELERGVGEILLTPDVRRAAAALTGRLRTLDAVHVASALSLGENLTALVTYDKRMLETALAAGLPAHAPGMAT